MKKILLIILTLAMVTTTMLFLSACGKEQTYNVKFIVNGEVIKVVETAGNEKIELPENPVKEGYEFEGWFLDTTFETPFTSSTYENKPLNKNIKVYAKFKGDNSDPSHSHSFTTTTIYTTCSTKGYKAHTCSCGYSYNDNYEDAKGHKYDEESASIVKFGSMYKVSISCSDCGKTNTLVATYDREEKPDCRNEGYKVYKYTYNNFDFKEDNEATEKTVEFKADFTPSNNDHKIGSMRIKQGSEFNYTLNNEEELDSLFENGKLLWTESQPGTCSEYRMAGFFCESCQTLITINLYAKHDYEGQTEVLGETDCIERVANKIYCNKEGKDIISSYTGGVGHNYVADASDWATFMSSPEINKVVTFRCECGDFCDIEALRTTRTIDDVCVVTTINTYTFSRTYTVKDFNNEDKTMVFSTYQEFKSIDGKHSVGKLQFSQGDFVKYNRTIDNLIKQNKIYWTESEPASEYESKMAGFFCDKCSTPNKPILITIQLTGRPAGGYENIGTLSGKVAYLNMQTKQNVIISGATITLEKGGETIGTTTSANDGSYTFEDIEYGEYVIKVTKSGYNDINYTFNFVNEEEALDIIMDITQSSKITGIITNADKDVNYGNNKPLSGITVWLIKTTGLTELKISTITDSDGRYTFENLPVGIYELKIEMSGYIKFVDIVNVYKGINNVAPPMIEIIKKGENGVTTGGASGMIYDSAVQGNVGVEGLTLRIYRGASIGEDSTPILTIKTKSGGKYSIDGIEAGNYIIKITDERNVSANSKYYESTLRIKILPGVTIVDQNGSVFKNLNANQLRIVLEWGEYPHDIDSHMISPSGAHVYFSNLTYEKNNQTILGLDRDDTDSYGPETTTVYKFEDGVYKFYVHDYSNRGSSNSSGLGESGAVVRIYTGNALLYTLYVPKEKGTLWHVFNYNSQTGEFTFVNQMSYKSSASNIGG